MSTVNAADALLNPLERDWLLDQRIVIGQLAWWKIEKGTGDVLPPEGAINVPSALDIPP